MSGSATKKWLFLEIILFPKGYFLLPNARCLDIVVTWELSSAPRLSINFAHALLCIVHCQLYQNAVNAATTEPMTREASMSNGMTKFWVHIKDIFWIFFGLALYAAAWNIFVLPHGFVGGGFGGISAMLFYMTDIPIFVWYLGFNIILCAVAWLILGNEFSIKTVIGILGLTFLLWAIKIPESWLVNLPVLANKLGIESLVCIDVSTHPIIADKLLSAIMGGIIGGAGVATYLLHGASTGGSDIIVMIVAKYKNISWGRVYLIFDACVITSSILLPDSTLGTVAYGFVFMGVQAYAVDMVSNGRRQSVQLFIFTSKYKEIADRIIHKHHRGATLFESIGWYTKQHRKTIYLVARKRETQEIFKTVKAIDPHAFIAVSNVMSVFGIGFDAIKAGFTKPTLKDANGNEIQLDDKERIPEPDEMPQPPNAPAEVSADMAILEDEKQANLRIAEGREAQYDPHWETPASEIMTIPEGLEEK